MKLVSLLQSPETLIIIGSCFFSIIVITISLYQMDGKPVQLFYHTPKSMIGIGKKKLKSVYSKRGERVDTATWTTTPFLHQKIRFTDPLQGDQQMTQLRIYSTSTNNLLFDSQKKQQQQSAKPINDKLPDDSNNSRPWWRR
jgi:hypothetical protein